MSEVNKQSVYASSPCKPVRKMPELNSENNKRFVYELEVLLQQYIDCQARQAVPNARQD